MAGQTRAAIQLGKKEKICVITGAGLLWFFNCMFSFTMAVVLPSVMERYKTMGLYAILSGLVALLACIAVPIGGKLGDRYGRRKACLWTGYLRMALLISCAIPTSGPVFFGAYAAASLLGGLMGSYPMAILGDVTDTTERPRWFGLFGGINGAAFVLGLFLGGVVVDYMGALTAFTVFTPCGVIAMILLTLYYPNRPAEDPAPIDKVGMTLMALGVACILAWCAFGGLLFPRLSVLGILLLASGCVLMGLFFYAETRIKDPLLDLRMFRMKPFAMSFSTNLLIAPMMCLCSSILVLFGQMSLGLSATVSGTLAVPKNIMFALIPPILGVWVAKDHRRFRTLFLTCGILLTIGCLMSATWNETTTILTIYLSMLVFGGGTCCQAASIQAYTQVSIPQKYLGIASAMIIFGNSFGVAVFNAVYNIVYNARYNEAMALGGGAHLARAMSEVFSLLSIFSAACTALVVVLALVLIPRGKKSGAKTAAE